MSPTNTTNKTPHALVCAHVMLIKGNEILLGLRENTGWRDGYYSLVGGHVEAGETVRQGAIREAKEEAGIVIQEKDLSIFEVDDSLENVERGQCLYISYFFTVTKWKGSITNREPHKCRELRFFSFEDLPANLLPYIAKVIHEMKARL